MKKFDWVLKEAPWQYFECFFWKVRSFYWRKLWAIMKRPKNWRSKRMENCKWEEKKENFQQSSAPESLMMKTDKGKYFLFFLMYLIEERGNEENTEKQTNNEKLLYICQKAKSNFPSYSLVVGNASFVCVCVKKTMLWISISICIVFFFLQCSLQNTHCQTRKIAMKRKMKILTNCGIKNKKKIQNLN